MHTSEVLYLGHCTQVKCYIQMSGAMEPSELQDALEVIDSTNLKYFTKEMIAEFMALKGSFLAHIGRYVHVHTCTLYIVMYIH